MFDVFHYAYCLKDRQNGSTATKVVIFPEYKKGLSSYPYPDNCKKPLVMTDDAPERCLEVTEKAAQGCLSLHLQVRDIHLQAKGTHL